jgi:CRISPR/Cas system endoribonuclease Cas6 (RAMP superfamily)
MKIYVDKNHDGSYRLKISSPDKDLFYEAIESLKSFFPAYLREYDPQTRRWIISHDADLYSWLEAAEINFDAEVSWGNERKQPFAHKQGAPTTDELFAALHLLPSAPPEVIKAAYRALSMLHHPDLGGNEFEMKKLNLVYEKLRAA